MPHPWDTGDLSRNWQGYFIPGTHVLRNRIGATIHAELEDAENDLVESRVVELRENPGLLARSYDLRLLQAIHRHLFQDVYLWAGDVRTVGIEKGDESFCPPGSIRQPMDHIAADIHHLKRLTTVADTDLPRTVAYTYEYVNFAHPFREGNGGPPANSSTSCSPNTATDSTGIRPTSPSCTTPATQPAPTATSPD